MVKNTMKKTTITMNKTTMLKILGEETMLTARAMKTGACCKYVLLGIGELENLSKLGVEMTGDAISNELGVYY